MKLIITVLFAILLRRRNLVGMTNTADYTQTKQEKAMVVSMLKNVQSLGYTFSKNLLETLFHCNRSELVSFHNRLIPELKKLAGADVVYKPMYPNFPSQVMEADEAELFINAIVHYWSFGELMPAYEAEERFPLIDTPKLKVLDLGTKDDLMTVFSNLVGSKTSLSVQDKEDMVAIMDNVTDYADYLPDTIPLKENVAFISSEVIKRSGTDAVSKWFKTATDVLRFVTALSDGDISLAGNTKFRNLKRSERRMVMDLLAGCGNLVEDMYRYQQRWIRVGEILHPFEFKQKKYEKVVHAFHMIRNKQKPLMFAGKVQQNIDNGDVCEAADLLQDRPGEFARKLDKLLRDATASVGSTGCVGYVLDAFREVAAKVATPLLLQVRQHFMNRQKAVRVFFPKGNLAKVYSRENDLPEISERTCSEVVRICDSALRENFSERETMGKVFLDEAMRNYIVPFSQRSASKTVKAVTRGSKIPVSADAKAVRGFIWWTNIDKSSEGYWEDSRVDLDLSAAIFDENWNYVEHISYTYLRSAKYQACHSGDITNGGPVNGDGVAEFLDFDIDTVANNAGRYVVFQVYSFTGQTFDSMPNARFGWMNREDVNSGEIFEPSTVAMKMDLTSKDRVSIPAIFDCVERKFIWCDMGIALPRTGMFGNNLESNLRGVNAVCYAMVNMEKPSMYDLVLLNAMARGSLVMDRNQADIIFSPDTTVPYEVVEEVDETTGLTNRSVRDKVEVPIVTPFDVDVFMTLL